MPRTMILLAAGSFVLGLLTALAVLIVRELGLRRDISRIAEGVGELLRGNAAFRIRSIKTPDAALIADRINALAEGAQARLEESQQHQEAHRLLVANISHDLRTPITSIAGYADALRRGIGDEPQRYLDILADKTKQLAGLTDDLFYMSRIDSGDLVLDARTLDVCEIARQQLLGYEPQLSAADAVVRFLLPDGQCRTLGDESAMRRIIDNVVSNALRHAQGMTLITLALETSASAFELTIADNGPGLTSGAERLFDRGASEGGGTGLGLAIARELAEGMGMTLIAENAEPQGTVFRLRGPRLAEGASS